MPCNRNIPRCSGTNRCCHETLLETLDFIVKQFEENDISYFLTFGTLLGAVREHKFIPWDEDIDIGIMLDDLPKALKLSQVFQKEGFGWNVGADGEGYVGKINVFVSLLNDLHVDVSVYRNIHEGCGKIFTRGVFWPGCYTRFENTLPANLKRIEFEGKQYSCPNNPEELLKNFYGDDWETPKVKGWIKERLEKCAVPDQYLIQIMNKQGWYKWEPGRNLK